LRGIAENVGKQKSRLATAFCFSLLAAHPFQTAANLV
jgi:hypothetical protein